MTGVLNGIIATYKAPVPVPVPAPAPIPVPAPAPIPVPAPIPAPVAGFCGDAGPTCGGAFGNCVPGPCGE